MAQATMYDGAVNSPMTVLDDTLTIAATTVPVFDETVFPTAPNLAVLGDDEDAETILYTGVSTGSLTGVTRAVQGTAAEWPSGTVIGRLYTELDHARFISNIEDIVTRLEVAENIIDHMTDYTATSPTSNVWIIDMNDSPVDSRILTSTTSNAKSFSITNLPTSANMQTLNLWMNITTATTTITWPATTTWGETGQPTWAIGQYIVTLTSQDDGTNWLAYWVNAD